MAAVPEAAAEEASPAGEMWSILGIVLAAFGGMILLVGTILSSICLLGATRSCGGGMGAAGFWMFTIGLAMVVSGAAFIIRGRKLRRKADRLRRFRHPSADNPEGLVALNCPNCGAPIGPDASVCEFCGQTFG